MPITFGLLAKLFNYLQNVIFNSVIGLDLQTACLVAFRGFLRCGKFTCWNSFDNNIHLRIGDIYFVSHDCVKLFLKTSKTVVIQRVYIKFLKTDSDLCPYKLLRKFIINRKSCNATQKDSLFVQEHNTALSRNYFIIKLKALISCLCFVHCDYSGHSYGQHGEKCDLLNTYFSFISSLEDANVPLPDIELKTDNFLQDIVITTEEIVDIIKIIIPNMASGPEIISHKM